MVHPPFYYANLLKNKILRYGSTCWLVNTGWVGGSYGIGKRISIHYTRELLDAALNNGFENVEFYTDPVFGFQVPKHCGSIPEEVFYPAKAWPSNNEYMQKYRQLAARFIDNFKRFENQTTDDLTHAGPKI